MDGRSPSPLSLAIWAVIIFAVAVALRVPSCYESFWVDELHSAWCVWDGFGDVHLRSTMGHQSPFYFLGLWVWKQAFGDSEVALRMSSVLAVAISSVIVTMGVGRWSGSTAAGVAAGAVLAIEKNSLFFGTELRPYAFVLFFSSIAIIGFLYLSQQATRGENPRSWSMMICAVLLSALSQPTSLGVLAWLPVTLGCIWLLRSRRWVFKFSMLDILLGLVAAGVAFHLWSSVLSDAWQQRSNWTAFASASHLAEIWNAWDWPVLVFAPAGLSVGAVAVAAMRRKLVSIQSAAIATALVFSIAVLATCLYWAVSRVDWAPVWHRRFYVSALPLMACGVGCAIGALQRAIPRGRISSVVTWAAVAAIVITTAHEQGTLRKLDTYPVALVSRGEDWRRVVDWVRSSAMPADKVYVDAGLIEAQSWLADEDRPSPFGGLLISPGQASARQLEFLAFPLNGPYRIEREILPIRSPTLSSHEMTWLPHLRPGNSRAFVISRRPASRVPESAWATVFGFGNLSVIVHRSAFDLAY